MEHFHNSGSSKLQNFYLVPQFNVGKVDPNFRSQSKEGVDLPKVGETIIFDWKICTQNLATNLSQETTQWLDYLSYEITLTAYKRCFNHSRDFWQVWFSFYASKQVVKSHKNTLLWSEDTATVWNHYGTIIILIFKMTWTIPSPHYS